MGGGEFELYMNLLRTFNQYLTVCSTYHHRHSMNSETIVFLLNWTKRKITKRTAIRKGQKEIQIHSISKKIKKDNNSTSQYRTESIHNYMYASRTVPLCIFFFYFCFSLYSHADVYDVARVLIPHRGEYIRSHVHS